MSTTARESTWWGALRHGGVLIAPSHLERFFGADALPPSLPAREEERLRRGLARLEAQQQGAEGELLDAVLVGACDLGRAHHLETGLWLQGSELDASWTERDAAGAPIKPRRVWRGSFGALLPVFFTDTPRLGVGHGRRSHAQVLEWLRRRGQRLALLTNGAQWRLIHAGLDHDAWVESESARWFEGGAPSDALLALRVLLSPRALIPPSEGKPAQLVEAIEATRRGQSELSAELGERVRRAVELLIQEHGPAIAELIESEAARSGAHVTTRHAYLAATRVVMRLVVLLFAEARENLLPTDLEIWHTSYSLGALREALDRTAGAAGEGRLKGRLSAWPRILALFKVVNQGSAHPELPVRRYGGGLFRPGAPRAEDPVLRVLSLFESACFDARRRTMDDAAVHRVLELLTRCEIRVAEGRGRRTVTVPVSFSDLSSEYIGILYEGLLDYELRRGSADDPVVFLNLGDQPALPLSRLESLPEEKLSDLVEKLKKGDKKKLAGEGEDDADEDGEEEDDPDLEPGDTEPHLYPAVAETDGLYVRAVAEHPDSPGYAARSSGPSETQPLAEDPGPSAAEELTAPDDERLRADTRAWSWAATAVKAGKLVAKPRSKKGDAQRAYDDAVEAAAHALIARVVLPGEFYLVRYGGTRKGSGTFYTKPQLAVPTVQRTLRPLAYDPPKKPDGSPHLAAPASAWTPKSPERILALKVCDPACGSGSFLVAALRFLTSALHDSLHHHGCIRANGDQALITLAAGKEGGIVLADDPLPCRPDDERFDELLRARLKRYVVERCIHGVDLDPLAVELCRMALWIETMDRDLPFTFLDHRVKAGNALVGTWFDRFRDYPAMAWNRKGGDEDHERFRHHFVERQLTRGKKKGETVREGDVWGAAIKRHLEERVKPALVSDIASERHRSEGEKLGLVFGGPAPEERHRDLVALVEKLHTLPVHEAEERTRLFEEELRPALAGLRAAFDTWCALWFWPAEELEHAPLAGKLEELDERARAIVARLAEEQGFFHWEIEFPDVFRAAGSGFDAVLGNPPWETQQPESKEFFSNIDPLYRTYGKQDALARQCEIFEASERDEDAWLKYVGQFKALVNWAKCAGSPFGDPEKGGETMAFTKSGKSNEDLHLQWRKRRARRSGFADPAHPFQVQGDGKPYTYKLFLEMAHSLLRVDGRLGFVVPSGLYTDKGSTELRKLFLERCTWEWLFGFENRDKLFDIHRSFKFGPVVVKKGGRTEAVNTAFMRRALSDWETPERFAIPYELAQVARFSPNTRALLEIRSKRDLEILEQIYSNSVLVGDQSEEGWGIKYKQGDFNMTADSKLFPPRPKWEAQGYQPDEYSRWLLTKWWPRGGGGDQSDGVGRGPGGAGGSLGQAGAGGPASLAPPNAPRHKIPAGVILSRDGTQFTTADEIQDIALPLYQGVMIWQLDWSAGVHTAGSGLSTEWVQPPWERKYVQGQYLMGLEDIRRAVPDGLRPRLAFRDVQNATNQRTMIACALPAFPAGNTVPILQAGGLGDDLLLLAALTSFPLDRIIRMKISQAHLNWFYVEELPLPTGLRGPTEQIIRDLAASLAVPGWSFAEFWHEQWKSGQPSGHSDAEGARGRAHDSRTGPQGLASWALTPHERLRRRCMLDALMAELYALEWEDLAHLLADCDHPVQVLASRSLKASFDQKGFWRVDKDKDPELRHTVLSLCAFRDLKRTIEARGGDRVSAIASFCAADNGQGWQLPEHLRLADYDLGRDDRARQPQPVASRFGPRFFEFQLAQSAVDTWSECAIHAANLSSGIAAAARAQ